MYFQDVPSFSIGEDWEGFPDLLSNQRSDPFWNILEDVFDVFHTSPYLQSSTSICFEGQADYVFSHSYIDDLAYFPKGT